MGRILLVSVVALGMAGIAVAAPKKKVQIETTPPGASVYIEEVETGEVCKTPCPIEVDAGSTVIIQLAGHKPLVKPMKFEREKPPYKRTYALVASVGTIIVEGPRGASVSVDDEDKGKAPVEFEVSSGTHAVVLTLNGKQVYAGAVEVVANEPVTVTGSAPGKTVADKTPPPGDETPVVEGPKPEVREEAKPKPARAGPLFAASLATSVGFRDFAYQNANLTIDENLNPENERGQILVGPLVEVWPGTLVGIHMLRGLSMFARFQLGVNSQVVKTDENMATAAKTFWRSFEAGAKQRWVFADTASVEIGAGYVRDQHQFSGELGAIAAVPDADYQSIKIGARVSALLGALEPYAAYENRVVMSGGPLQDRFMQDGASISGFRLALGAGAKFGSVTANLEGAITRYSWKISNAPATGTDGATDSIKQVLFVVGYAY